MDISQKGLALLKKYESFKSRGYLCPAGKLTIGYGHVLKKGEIYKTITKEKAEELLNQDIRIAKYIINKHVKVALNQNQFDALVSLVYNWGSYNFLRSVGLRKLNLGDYNGAIMEFKDVVRSGKKILKGLVKRRLEEAELFLQKDS